MRTGFNRKGQNLYRPKLYFISKYAYNNSSEETVKFNNYNIKQHKSCMKHTRLMLTMRRYLY